jgi:hypothetical protein
MSMADSPHQSGAPTAGALISSSKFSRDTGISPVTIWRMRKKGWLESLNICGRVYHTQAAIDKFIQRAAGGEFTKEHKVPARTSSR